MCTLIKLIVERCTCISSTCNHDGGREVENVIENIGCIVITHAYSVNSCLSHQKR